MINYHALAFSMLLLALIGAWVLLFGLNPLASIIVVPLTFFVDVAHLVDEYRHGGRYLRHAFINVGQTILIVTIFLAGMFLLC
jgi:hypothetical protein